MVDGVAPAVAGRLRELALGVHTFVSTVLPWVRAPSPPYFGATQNEQIEKAVGERVSWPAEQGGLVWAVTGTTHWVGR